jgi:hypothetical protein
MSFRRLSSFSIVALCFVLLVPLSGSANGQTIRTPAGELRLGMTEGEVTKLLPSPVYENRDDEGTVHSRKVQEKIEDRTFSASLTSRGIVYSISSHQSFPIGPVGHRAAELAFQHLLEEHVAPTTPLVIRTPGINGLYWKSSEGHPISIELKCDETVLLVEVSDYQQQLKDDGVSDEIQQHFRVPFYDLCF